jgi:hypothetical protein
VRLAGADRETYRRLGGTAYRGDAAEIMVVLTLDGARDVRQIAGQALLVALAQGLPTRPTLPTLETAREETAAAREFRM